MFYALPVLLNWFVVPQPLRAHTLTWVSPGHWLFRCQGTRREHSTRTSSSQQKQ